MAGDTDPLHQPVPTGPDVAEELRLARRELKFVRAAEERMAEDLQRTRRQRARLKEQAEVLSESLAALMSEAFAAANRRPLGRITWGRGDAAEERRMVAEVEASDLFDAAWYLRRNLDAVRLGLSPALHYVRIGGLDGRDPSERFNTRRYLAVHPDARVSGLPPLVHHLRNPDDVARAPFDDVAAPRDVHL